MLAEIKALEPQLKQIVYGCVEHVQATKAALYLSTEDSSGITGIAHLVDAGYLAAAEWDNRS